MDDDLLEECCFNLMSLAATHVFIMKTNAEHVPRTRN